MREKIITMILILITAVFGLPVDRQTAESAAKNWLSYKNPSGSYGKVSGYINIKDGVHAFNFEGGGFALIAAEDASIPVLGYSDTGYFDIDDEKTNLNFWVGLYSKAIEEIREKKLSNDETLPDWDKVLSGRITQKDSKAVAPLLTTTWNQSPIYNMYCPLDGGSRSVVGCVATAMAQIMNYHEYPKTGKSSSSYNILGQTLAVDYYLSRYDFSLMPNSLSSGSSFEAKHEVAQLSYHAGVSVEMMYSASSSGAYSEDVPNALKTYFKYLSAVHNYRSSYNGTTWREMLQTQLNNGKPLYYSGSGPDGGHAFVCDGYQDADYYHFNWGWGGSSDGYYSIDNLNPGGYTFNNYQAVVKDIIPKTTDLILLEPIPDVQTTESSYQIDLSNHFSTVSGTTITYSIDPKSNLNGLQCSITSGILTLNKLTDGVSKIILTCTTKTDNNFDEFYFQFGSGGLMAGFGKSYNFDSSAYLDAGNSTEMNALKTMSFSTWIKFNSVGKEQGIFSKSAGTNSGWYMIIQSNNLLKFSVKTKDGITRRIYSNSALTAGRWYHIDAVYDGKDLMIYIDGELDNIKTTYTAYSDILSDSANNVLLGNAYNIFLDGILDETVIWDKAASLDEVREIMCSRPDVISMTGITAYWPINEGFFDKADDMTGINNGTFVNNDLANWAESDAPVYFFADKNTALNSFLIGDEDAAAVYAITAAPASGTAEITGASAGAFTYYPGTDYTGMDEFKYSITYGDKTTPEKTVVISVKEPSGIEDNEIQPSVFELFQNYPNPFNPMTQIRFSLAKTAEVKLSVYNISGQLVSQLASGVRQAGYHTVNFDGSKLNSGVYYYTLETEGKSMAKKMLLVK
jgi:hypothetical protein